MLSIPFKNAAVKHASESNFTIKPSVGHEPAKTLNPPFQSNNT